MQYSKTLTPMPLEDRLLNTRVYTKDGEGMAAEAWLRHSQESKLVLGGGSVADHVGLWECSLQGSLVITPAQGIY